MIRVPALMHRNFRLLWSGQLVSSIGDQMQIITIAWHIYQITNSTVALGLIALFRLVPFMALSLLGGALADAVDRRKLMALTQTGQMLVALWLVATTAAGIEDPWPIYVAAVAGGVFMAFDGPARQAMIPNLVPPADLAGALTLNTMVRQVSIIVGPGIGGVAVAALGPGVTYAINAVSFVAVLAALFAMHGVNIIAAPQAGKLQQIRDGLAFARGEPLVLLPLVLDFITRALGSPRGLLPVFARDVFQVGPVGLGWLAGAGAAGAGLGGIWMTSRRHMPRPVLLMLLAYLIEALLNASFAVAPGVLVAWVVLFLGGICNVVGEVLHETIIQLRTPDHLRGRTTALAGMLAIGGPLSGNLEVGLLASVAGATGAVAFNGLAGAAVTLGFALAPPLRSRLATSRMEEVASAR